MHKSRYKFPKKRNKCEVTIKSTITKGTIIGGKGGWNNKKFKKKKIKRDKIGERERERIDLFCNEQLGRNRGERWKWSKINL